MRVALEPSMPILSFVICFSPLLLTAHLTFKDYKQSTAVGDASLPTGTCRFDAAHLHAPLIRGEGFNNCDDSELMAKDGVEPPTP
jgi:hypothetical protein